MCARAPLEPLRRGWKFVFSGLTPIVPPATSFFCFFLFFLSIAVWFLCDGYCCFVLLRAVDSSTSVLVTLALVLLDVLFVFVLALLAWDRTISFPAVLPRDPYPFVPGIFECWGRWDVSSLPDSGSCCVVISAFLFLEIKPALFMFIMERYVHSCSIFVFYILWFCYCVGV